MEKYIYTTRVNKRLHSFTMFFYDVSLVEEFLSSKIFTVFKVIPYVDVVPLVPIKKPIQDIRVSYVYKKERFSFVIPNLKSNFNEKIFISSLQSLFSSEITNIYIKHSFR
jgi:hypothetical protein